MVKMWSLILTHKTTIHNAIGKASNRVDIVKGVHDFVLA
jgi:hypothetical protein